MTLLKNSFIVKDGIIFNWRGIYEESLVASRIKWQYTPKFFLKQLITGKWRVFLSTPVLIVYDAWSGNIFHWLYDCLPRIRRMINEDKTHVRLILPESFKSKDYVQLTLPLFYEGSVEYLPEAPFVFSRKIVFADKELPSGTYNRDDLIAIQARLNTIKGGKSYGSRIYISRQRSVYRRIVNQQEVEKLLEKKGFVPVFLEDHSYKDQLSILSSAECVVASHGAGLAHILMMQEGGGIVEIIPDSSPLNKCYQALALELNLRHSFLIGKGTPGLDFQKDDIEVPLDQLEESLNIMLH